MDEWGSRLTGQSPSVETRRKAEAAKSYIENMYKVQQHNVTERRERCDLISRCFQRFSLEEFLHTWKDAQGTMMSITGLYHRLAHWL